MRSYDTTDQERTCARATGKREHAGSGMSDQTLSATTDGGAAVDARWRPASPKRLSRRAAKPGRRRKKKDDKPLEERKVHEAGGVIVCDGKVVLRLTDKQRWIFPKGKLKKRESPRDAAMREATEETGPEAWRSSTRSPIC